MRFLVLLMPLFSMAHADVLVLVHGWSANADTWIHSGVLPELESNGWTDAGVVAALPSGVAYYPAQGQVATNKIYRAHLPAEAPLQLQAAHLFAELQTIQQWHPSESITIAGHSAGGVIARLVLVRPESVRVSVLITIASPNLGTQRAIQGLDIADSKPFFCPGPGIDFLKSIFGGRNYRYLRYSRGALVDMVPAAPGTLLGWLNRQSHPDIAYHAIIRQGPAYAGDELVPAFSQDLNQVPPLRGRVQIHLTRTGHELNPADGRLLAEILSSIQG